MNETQETGTIFLEVKYGWQFFPILPLTKRTQKCCYPNANRYHGGLAQKDRSLHRQGHFGFQKENPE